VIKACNPESTIPVVWYGDPAVDADASNIGQDYLLRAMRNPTCWREDLKFKDGATPTEWILGIAPPSVINAAEDMPGSAAKAWHIFLHSVRDIKNAGSLTDSLPDRRPKKVTIGGVEYVDPEWLANVMRGHLRMCAKELGLIAYAWNQMTDEDAKN